MEHIREVTIMPKLYTTKEVADMLEMDHSQVRRAVAHGWLKGQLRGHTTFVTETSLQRWVDGGKRVYPNLNPKKNE